MSLLEDILWKFHTVFNPITEEIIEKFNDHKTYDYPKKQGLK